jgi:hypothetical protein
MTLNGSTDALEEKGQLFATIAARLFFFMLLLADIAWGIFSLISLIVSIVLNLAVGFKVTYLKTFLFRRYLNLKRSLICGVALIVSLFSPALGTMIACSYFLMYDKKGIEEVVPSVLQDQFQEFFNPLDREF